MHIVDIVQCSMFNVLFTVGISRECGTDVSSRDIRAQLFPMALLRFRWRMGLMNYVVRDPRKLCLLQIYCPENEQ